MKLRLPHQLLTLLLASAFADPAAATVLTEATLAVDSFDTDTISYITSDGWTLTNISGSDSGMFTMGSTEAKFAPQNGTGTTQYAYVGADRYLWSAIVTIDAETLKDTILLKGNDNQIGLGVKTGSNGNASVTGTWQGNASYFSKEFSLDSLKNSDGTITLGLVFDGAGTTIYAGTGSNAVTSRNTGLKGGGNPGQLILPNTAQGVSYSNLYWFKGALSDADMKAALADAAAGTNDLVWNGAAGSEWNESALSWTNGETTSAFSSRTADGQRNMAIFGAEATNKNITVSGTINMAADMRVEAAGYSFTIGDGAQLNLNSLHMADGASPAFIVNGSGVLVADAANSAAYILKNATGNGTIKITSDAIMRGVYNSATQVYSQATGSLIIGDGGAMQTELKLGRTEDSNGYQNNHVSIYSFQNVTLDNAKLWYHTNMRDGVDINNLTVTQQGGEIYIQDTPSGGQPLLLGGTTTLNGQLTLSSWWKSSININKLTGTGTLKVYTSGTSGDASSVTIQEAAGVALVVNDAESTVTVQGVSADKTMGNLTVSNGTLNIAGSGTYGAANVTGGSLNVTENATFSSASGSGSGRITIAQGKELTLTSETNAQVATFFANGVLQGAGTVNIAGKADNDTTDNAFEISLNESTNHTSTVLTNYNFSGAIAINGRGYTGSGGYPAGETLNIGSAEQNGSITVEKDLRLESKAHVNVKQNGSLTVNGNLILGHKQAGYPGYLNIDGGTVQLNGLSLQRTTDANELNLNSGILTFTKAGEIVTGGSAMDSTAINLNGGTLKADSVSWDLNHKATIGDDAVVNVEAAQGKEATLSGALSGGGTIKGTGKGTVTLSGDMASFTGALAVTNGGTMNLHTASTMNLGSHTLLADGDSGVLNLGQSGGNKATIAAASATIDHNATLNINNADLVLSGKLTLGEYGQTGTLNLNGGGLKLQQLATWRDVHVNIIKGALEFTSSEAVAGLGNKNGTLNLGVNTSGVLSEEAHVVLKATETDWSLTKGQSFNNGFNIGSFTVDGTNTHTVTLGGGTIKNQANIVNNKDLVLDSVVLAGRVNVKGTGTTEFHNGSTTTATSGYTLVAEANTTLKGGANGANATYAWGATDIALNTDKVLTLESGAQVTVKDIHYTDANRGHVIVKNGASLDSSGKIYIQSLTNEGETTIKGSPTKSIGAFSQSGAGSLELGNSVSLTTEKAEGGTIAGSYVLGAGAGLNIKQLGDTVTAALKDLTLATNATMGVYQGSTIEEAAEANVSVSGTLTAHNGAALNANLTMKNGSTIDVDYAHGGLTMGSTVTFEQGGKMNLSNNIINGLNSLTIGEGLTLFSGVDAFYINGAAYDANLTYKASDFFNLSNSDVAVTRPWDFVVKFGDADAMRQSGSGQSIYLWMETPEPATSTLSLLALAALAARRKRK